MGQSTKWLGDEQDSTNSCSSKMFSANCRGSEKEKSENSVRCVTAMEKNQSKSIPEVHSPSVYLITKLTRQAD